MVDYNTAFKLPFSNWKAALLLLLIASLANLTNIFEDKLIYVIGIFFSLLLYGYIVRIAKSASLGKNELPSFDAFPSLLMQGVKYLIAAVVYILPVFLASKIPAIAGAINSINAGHVTGDELLTLTPLFALALFLIYIFLLAVVHFAHENRFSAFFELGRIVKKAFTFAYFVPWFISVAYAIALLVLRSILLDRIVLVALVNPAVIFLIVLLEGSYMAIITPTTTSLYGQAYRDITTGKKAHKPAKK